MRDTTRRSPAWVPWTLLAVTAIAIAAGDLLRIVHALKHAPPAYPEWMETTTIGVGFGLVGFVVAARRPGNPVGWLMLGLGATSGLQLLTGEYAMYARFVTRDRWPAAAGAAWVSAVLVMLLLTTVPFLLLLFPDGSLLSRRWRAALAVCGLGAISMVISNALGPGEMQNTPGIVNPLGVGSRSVTLLFAWLDTSFAVGLIVGIGSLVVRWRRGSQVVRQQLKYVVFAVVGGIGSIAALSLLFPDLTSGSFGNVLWAAGVGVIPVAAGVAILRYRLYDIDRIVSRSVTYALVTGLLVSLYVGLVTLATRLTPSSSSLAVAGSTLAVAALFQPLRRRVQSSVDRRFDRPRYDAARTIEDFSGRLREEVDLASLRADLLAVVRRTMQPASVGLWLRSVS